VRKRPSHYRSDVRSAVSTLASTCAVALVCCALSSVAAHAQSNLAPVSVAAYGAKGDGVTDDTTSINSAIAAAEKMGPGAIVNIPAGRYLIGTGAVKSVIINGADHLTVRGMGGATIVSADLDEPVVRINSSKSVTFRRLSLDRSPLGFTQGTITSVNVAQMTCDVTIDSGYPDPTAAWLKGADIHVFTHPDVGYYQLDTYWPRPTVFQSLGGNAWRFTLSGPPNIANWPGKQFFLMGNCRGHAFDMFDVQDTTIEDVNYWGGGGNAGFYLGRLTGTTTFRRFVIGVPPGSGRVYSCGGGGQISGLRGNLVFDSCDFSKIDDDGCDILSTWTRILDQPDSHTLHVQSRDDNYEAGDHIEIWDWLHKKMRSEAVLTSATKNGDSSYTLAFDRDVQTERVGPGDGPPFGTKAMTDGIDRIIDVSTVGQSTLFRNCHFQVFRAKCINLKAPNTIITGCTFSHSYQPAISASPEWYFEEGPTIRNLTIENCKFIDCNHSNISVGAAPTAGVHGADPSLDSSPGSDSRDSSNILIQNNTFSGYGATVSVFPWWPFGALEVTNANGVTVRGNDFGPAYPNTPDKIQKVVIARSDNVAIRDNTGLK
jgi:hypothetical protein